MLKISSSNTKKIVLLQYSEYHDKVTTTCYNKNIMTSTCKMNCKHLTTTSSGKDCLAMARKIIMHFDKIWCCLTELSIQRINSLFSNSKKYFMIHNCWKIRQRHIWRLVPPSVSAVI